MQQYLDIVKNILERGEEKQDRTGTGTISLAGVMFKHDMSCGFPLLTTKKVAYKCVRTELEFFIKGITDKKWLQDRGNHIWDEWCTPLKVPYAHDEETKKRMLEERDLGAIYGWEWRHFGAEYKDYNTDYTGQGVDQLKKLVEEIKTKPWSRQMLVIAWNPLDIDKAVPPYCHYAFQVTVVNNKLNLFWNQRSVDTALGLPFNIASYATLLHLLALETGYGEGTLVGFLGDTHIYLNHIDGLKEQITRDPNKYPLPTIQTENFTSIFDWQYSDTKLINYQSYPKISFEIAV
ncbi:thymidylate synthase [Patescibacteria group bacterium]|nr:thymidylate synthase [Patescibacteria group bacterium]MCG2693633.1 thymidylate synthase [Candidatus Parcubacteria bacterium]